jgi:hypothetical protein
MIDGCAMLKCFERLRQWRYLAGSGQSGLEQKVREAVNGGGLVLHQMKPLGSEFERPILGN